MYIESIDLLKGILIINVFLGHLILGDVKENLIRYFIYSFHMPLFIGVSGYLFNYFLFKTKPKVYLKKFIKKVLVIYIIANIVYSLFINLKIFIFNGISLSLLNFLKPMIYSYYHLWYIQGLLSYILISYFLLKLKSKNRIIIFSLVLSVIIYIFYFIDRGNNIIFNIFLNNFRMYNLIFFIVGCLKRENLLYINLSYKNYFILIILVSINSILNYYIQNPMIELIFFYISNIYTILIILEICEKFKKLKVESINFIGKNSIYFYLWHILPIIILRKFIKYKWEYYIYGVISFYILYFIVKIYKKTFDKNKEK